MKNVYDITDEFEKQLGTYFNHDRILTLNSATSAEHLAFHMLKKPSINFINFDGVGSVASNWNGYEPLFGKLYADADNNGVRFTEYNEAVVPFS